MHDLILTGGRVHDGFGSLPVTMDIAVSEGSVTAVGRVDGEFTGLRHGRVLRR
ncbi:hypothetical protein [Streptomyces tubercidicus]|uniref:hypothetical protein n=1 Tax=Streptomyces tubercidicus TaxID=47759 RepID=UPI00346552F1